MEPLYIAAILGLLASIGTAVTSLFRGIVKYQAEAMLVQRLRSDREVLRRILDLHTKLQPKEQDASAVNEAYLPTLLKAADTLSETDRKRVLEALKQPSEAGRSNYIKKLVQESIAAARQSA